MTDFTPRETVKASAAEVKAKLKSDLSRMTRVRRAVSVKPMMGCVACDATGRLPCITCDGTGKSKVVVSEEAENCATCEGRGTVTCVDCSGRGEVPNVHRKKILWVLGIGGAAWLIVFWVLWGPDILPQQRAKYISGGGGGSYTGTPVPPGSRANPMGQNGPANGVVMPNSGSLQGNQPIQPNPGMVGRPAGGPGPR